MQRGSGWDDAPPARGCSRRDVQPVYPREVGVFILKTVEEFCRKPYTLFEGFHGERNATYYPAKKYHIYGAVRDGMPKEYGDFYVRAARRVWELLDPRSDHPQTTHDAVIKAAELEQVLFPGKALIVDEAQDMTECNLTWITRAAQRRGRFILLVGDEVQTIYGFRGCKAKFLSNVRAFEAKKLTSCWRFGPAIAAVANTILYAKENSSQDHMSYRLRPSGRYHGKLYTREGFPTGIQRTFLAFTNVSLLRRSLEYLQEIPGCKFAFNGKSDASGKGKFKSIISEVSKFMKVYTGESAELDLEEFNETYTWESLVNKIQREGLTRYEASLGLIRSYGEDTMNVLKTFVDNVYKKAVSPEEADVILSTIHSAKGMEWDNVEVGEDLAMLNLFSNSGFDFPSWGDGLNLWYVAVTRAKRRLVLPEKFLHLLESFEMITSAAEYPLDDRKLVFPPWEDEIAARASSQKTTGWFKHACREQVWRYSQAESLYKRFVAPWAEEVYGLLPDGLVIDGIPYDSFKLVEEEESQGTELDATQRLEPDREASPTKRPRYE